MSSTNQNREERGEKNGKITAAKKRPSLQVQALHIFLQEGFLLQGRCAPPLSESLGGAAGRGGRGAGKEI